MKRSRSLKPMLGPLAAVAAVAGLLWADTAFNGSGVVSASQTRAQVLSATRAKNLENSVEFLRARGVDIRLPFLTDFDRAEIADAERAAVQRALKAFVKRAPRAERQACATELDEETMLRLGFRIRAEGRTLTVEEVSDAGTFYGRRLTDDERHCIRSALRAPATITAAPSERYPAGFSGTAALEGLAGDVCAYLSR